MRISKPWACQAGEATSTTAALPQTGEAWLHDARTSMSHAFPPRAPIHADAPLGLAVAHMHICRWDALTPTFTYIIT